MDTIPDVTLPSIELVIEGRARDLGGFTVRRVLPFTTHRRVGPFTFFDQMGPVSFPPGQGMDVRPHPHIGLATVTYLFDGAIDHCDSLGSVQTIRPGDVNWMVAGRGIAHSERSPAEGRRDGARLHGIQSWIALPVSHEETEPRFTHHPASTIPTIRREGVVLDVVAGTAYGEQSPVEVFSPTLYVHARLERGATLEVDNTHEERAVYLVEGAIRIDGQTYEPGTMIVLRSGVSVTLEASEASRVMMAGGATLHEEHYIWWNFVSSSEARIERAKDDWKHGRFAKVPGDEEFIPLPEK